MATSIQNNFKLGLFVTAGLVVLILSLYLIGKNNSFFGASFELRSRFPNASGLTKGNNVLYAGIQAGTVKDIRLINDTTVELTMLIDDDLSKFVNQNAIVSIGTEGLMGNRVVQIQPNGFGPAARKGELLRSRQGADIEQMMQVLSRTTTSVDEIASELKITMRDISHSALLALLKDRKTAEQLNSSLVHINLATANASLFSKRLADASANQAGTLGMLLTDTVLAGDVRQAAVSLRNATGNTQHAAMKLDELANMIDSSARKGNGLLYFALKDSLVARKLNATLDHIQLGTQSFSENMEALKHNFLFSGYFKRLEREKNKKQ